MRSSSERAGEDVNVCTNMASVRTDTKGTAYNKYSGFNLRALIIMIRIYQ